MAFLEYWTRNTAGQRDFDEVPNKAEHNTLKGRVDQIVAVIPYVQQAFTVCLFNFSNPNTYPQTRNSLQALDAQLIAANSYDGLAEGEKAQALIDLYYLTHNMT